MFFSLNKLFAGNTSVDPDDTRKMKGALNGLGFYDADKENPDTSPIPNRRVFNAVKDYQRDNGLRVDGVVKPDGETHRSLREKVKQGFGAGMDFGRNLWDSKWSNTKGADKYFHCKANYQATKRGAYGEKTAKWLSDNRERSTMQKNINKLGKEWADYDSKQDQAANLYGREAAKSGRI